jgi:Tfp pilus assembly protein PilP
MMPDNKLNFCLTNLVLLGLMVLILALANPAQGQQEGDVNLTFDVTSSGQEAAPAQGEGSLAPAQPGSLPMFDPMNPGALAPTGQAPAVPPLPGEAPGEVGYPQVPDPSAGGFGFEVTDLPGQPQYPPVGEPIGQSDFSLVPLPASLPVPSGGATPLVLIPPGEEDEAASGDEPPTEEQLARREMTGKIHSELEKWHSDVLSTYVFNPSLLTDPFLPIESALPAAANPKRENSDKNKTPIQKLALSQFTLSAIIVASDPSDNSANVDSGGRGFIIKKGTMIGPNDGYVKEINENSVVIEEPEVNFRGETSYKETVLRLNQLDPEGMLEYFEE